MFEKLQQKCDETPITNTTRKHLKNENSLGMLQGSTSGSHIICYNF